MKSIFISLPSSLIVSMLVADAAMTILDIPRDSGVQVGIVAILTMMLFERGLAGLGVIGAISLFAQANAQGPGSQVVAPYLLLSIMGALILMPPLLRLLGMSVEGPRIG